MRHISQRSNYSVEDAEAKTGTYNAMYHAISEAEEEFSSWSRGVWNEFLLEMVNKVSQKRGLFGLEVGESRSPISRYREV